MTRVLTGLIAVLASGWFVPVSCSTATAVLAQASATESERPWTTEQRLGRFRVVARPGEGNAPFRALTLADLPELKAKQVELNFLMDRDTGRMEDAAEHATVSYQVLARTTSGQEIEVEHEDGDDQSFSRYRATATGVEPVSTRYGAVSRGIMMGAMAEGFAIAFVLYVFARIVKFVLRRRLAPPSPQP